MPKNSALIWHRWYIHPPLDMQHDRGERERKKRKKTLEISRTPIRQEDHNNIWRSFYTEHAHTLETKGELMGHPTTNEWPKSDVTLSWMKNLSVVFLVSGENLHESLKHSPSWHMASSCCGNTRKSSTMGRYHPLSRVWTPLECEPQGSGGKEQELLKKKGVQA